MNPLVRCARIFIVAACCYSSLQLQAAENSAVVERVGEDIRYLASDELEGRGPATAGLQKAADFMRDRFKELGVAGAGTDGGYYNPFSITIDYRVLKQQTKLVLHSPNGESIELERGSQFQPMVVGGAGDIRADVVFAGYGISAPKQKYDDYADVDLTGKVVVIIRREPQQGDPKSIFDGKKTTQHSYIRTKIQAAKKAKAAAIIMVNDPFSTKKNKKDALAPPTGFGVASSKIPFAHLRQSALNEVLMTTPLKVGNEELTSVESIAAHIDATTKPVTQPIDGWQAELKFTFEKVEAEVTNVMGVIEGEGPHANETIVIGAHYDHLGYGPFGSRKPKERAIHNGADDNATGTAAVLELARRFAQTSTKPKRRLVFIGFTAEERGLVGSKRYLEDPAFPLESTVAMINFDMIGNLGDKGLDLAGVDTADVFKQIVDDAIDQDSLKVKVSGTLGGSDHVVFYRKGIPVLSCFTGLTKIYHTPADDFETINVAGVVETIDFTEQLVRSISELPERPKYQKRQPRGGRGAQAYLGIVPDYNVQASDGLAVMSVSNESPAAKGGIESGDVIIRLADAEVRGIDTLRAALRKFKAGQTVKIVVRRGDAEKTLNVVLGRIGN